MNDEQRLKAWNYAQLKRDTDTEILVHLSHGMTAREVSDITCMSYRTVQSRIFDMCHVLDCKNVHHLIATVLRLKIIE